MMKQPMNYGKGKAHKIRQTRLTASKLKNLSNIYKRVDKWEEIKSENQISFKVTLLSPWSFEENEYVSVRFFSSTSLAMRCIHKTFPVTEEMIFVSKKSSAKKLQDLIDLTEKLKMEQND